MPGIQLRRICDNNKVARVLATKLHLLSITDDHQQMWADAPNDAEREAVCARYRRQVALALVNEAAFAAALHGAGITFVNPMTGGALLVLGSVVMYYTTHGR